MAAENIAIQIEDVDAAEDKDLISASPLGGFHRTPSMEQLIPVDLGAVHPNSVKSSVKSSITICRIVGLWLFAKFADFVRTTKFFWIISLYSIMGAYLFMWLEMSTDLAAKQESYQYHIVARDVLLFKIKNVYNGNYLEKDQYIKQAIIEFENNAGFEASTQVESSWTFWMSILYSATIYTTVGYGNISCVTTGGRVATIFYAIFGIPLMIVVLDQLGDFLKKRIKEITFFADDVMFFLGVRYHLVNLSDRDSLARYISICKKLANWRLIAGTISITVSEYSENSSLSNHDMDKHSLHEALTTGLLDQFNLDVKGSVDVPSGKDHPKLLKKQSIHLSEEKSSQGNGAVGDRAAAKDYDGKRDAPVLAVLLVTAGWMAFAAAVFCMWEDWTYFTSVYFFFISMSTIGFGDVTPKYPEYMVASFFLVVVGLSLVSVCISVVQDKFSQIYMGVLEKMLQQYLNAQKDGDVEAIKGFVSGFNDRTKYLMPFISKNQNLKIMNQFKAEAKAQGVELPSVLTELNPETGKPAFCQIFEGEAMERFLKNAQTEGKLATKPVTKNAHTQTKQVPIRRAHKFFISKAEAGRGSFEAQTELEELGMDAEMQTSPVSSSDSGIQCCPSMVHDFTQFEQSFGAKDNCTITDRISTKTTGIQPEVSCILRIVGDEEEDEDASSGEYATSYEEDEQEEQAHLAKPYSQPGLLDPSQSQIPVLQAKRSLQMQRTAPMENSSLDYETVSKSVGETPSSIAGKYGWIKGHKKKGEVEIVVEKLSEEKQKSSKVRKKKKKKTETIGGLRYLKNAAIQTRPAGMTENGHQAGSPVRDLLDGWTGQKSFLKLVESETQTDNPKYITMGVQTVHTEVEEKESQTGTVIGLSEIKYQTEMVGREDVQVQTTGDELRESSADTFETANEEDFWQMKVTQTEVVAMTNRRVQTTLTNTLKHEGHEDKKKKAVSKGGITESTDEGQVEQWSKRKTSAENMAKNLERAKRAELKEAFHLEDDEIDHLRIKIKDWRKSKIAELLQEKSISCGYSEVGEVDSKQQVCMELKGEEFLQEEKALLLHELKALRAQKQSKKGKQKLKTIEQLGKKPISEEEKKYECTTGQEEEQEDEEEEPSGEDARIQQDPSASPIASSQPPKRPYTKKQKRKPTKPKEQQQYQMRVVQSEGGLIDRENFQQAILDVELSRNPNSQARFMPVEEELLISASVYATIKLEKIAGEVTEKETIREEDIDFEELLKKLLFEGVEEGAVKRDDEEEYVEDFTKDRNTQTEWLDAQIPEQLICSEVPAEKLHKILAELLVEKQRRDVFTQTDWQRRQEKQEDKVPRLEKEVQMATNLCTASAKKVETKGPTFSSQFKQTIPSTTDVVPAKIGRQPPSITKSAGAKEVDDKKKKMTGKFKGSKIERLVSKFEQVPIAKLAEIPKTVRKSAEKFDQEQLTSRSGHPSQQLEVLQSYEKDERPSTLSVPQHLLQSIPPIFLKKPEDPVLSEHVDRLGLSSEQALFPTTSRQQISPTTSSIQISSAQPFHSHPPGIQLSHVPRSTGLQTHLLQSGIIGHEMLPTSITRKRSVQPTVSTLSRLQPPYIMVEVDQSQLPPQFQDYFTSQMQAQLQGAQPSSSSQPLPSTLQLAYLPHLDLYLHPSNPFIQLQRSFSGTFVIVSNPLEDILPFFLCEYPEEEAGHQTQETVLGHILQMSDGGVQFLSIDSPSPIPENAKIRGQVLQTLTAIHFLPNPELEEPPGELATKILGEINHLLTTGVLRLPKKRRRSRVPELLQARIHFLEELNRSEVAFRDVSLRDTSNMDSRPSFSGWERREVEDKNEQLIGRRRDKESRRDRMLEVGIQTGVQARVQQMLGWDWRQEQVVMSPMQPTRMVVLRRRERFESDEEEEWQSSRKRKNDIKAKQE